MRLAWLYLDNNSLSAALELTCHGIKGYAESLGANDKFHLTLTDAIVRIMAKRRSLMNEKSWNLFQQQNFDLINDFQSVLQRYYSQEILSSDAARNCLIDPDIKSI